MESGTKSWFGYPWTFALLLFSLLLVSACAKSTLTALPKESVPAQPAAPPPLLNRMGYTIQVGAFTKLDNAVRLTDRLAQAGLPAYYFIHPSGKFKVRFGDYATYGEATAKAKELQAAGLIDAYYVVNPESYGLDLPTKDDHVLRSKLVSTAERFIGTPYKWGGESDEEGFDCSGLTMVVYRLNGLNLPRNSAAQFQRGVAVNRQELRKGDLLFFATKGGSKVSHVGIYTGDDRFIHAPKQGKNITTTSINSPYFNKCYLGARRYL